MTNEKRQELRSRFVMGVVDCKTLEEAKEQIEEYMARENTTPEIEFWGSLELVEIIGDD
jgi:hypothetical protein